MFTKNLFVITANWFANYDGLGVNHTEAAFAHDCVHAVFNIGVSLPEEELVLNLTNCLLGQQTNPKMEQAIEEAIVSVDMNLLVELSTYLDATFN